MASTVPALLDCSDSPVAEWHSFRIALQRSQLEGGVACGPNGMYSREAIERANGFLADDTVSREVLTFMSPGMVKYRWRLCAACGSFPADVPACSSFGVGGLTHSACPYGYVRC